jgi:bifunctional non-homologous end joining protein LigD
MAEAPMPAVIDPMKAVTGELPTEPGWAFEIKWDGMRLIAFCDRGSLRLQTTNRLDATLRFGELTEVAESLAAHRVVLDGEVVALSDSGRPDFGLLQSRMHTIPGRRGAPDTLVPITFMLFDLLWLDGNDVTGVSYLDRRHLLTDLVGSGPRWQVSAHHLGDGDALLAAATERGLEGVMAKQVDSTYTPGRRSPAWRKVKVRRRQELVVGGWLPGEGARNATFGALLVGYHTPEGLHYAGRVGTGFNADDLALLQAELGARASTNSPFLDPVPRPVERRARWVRPELVVEVTFGEWTSAGILRHPAYEGLRIDKDPARVVREPSP